VFWNDVGLYDEFGGVVLDMSESARICQAIGNKKAVILANHGLLTVGEHIERYVELRPGFELSKS